jgi:hypothetical protein
MRGKHRIQRYCGFKRTHEQTTNDLRQSLLCGTNHPDTALGIQTDRWKQHLGPGQRACITVLPCALVKVHMWLARHPTREVGTACAQYKETQSLIPPPSARMVEPTSPLCGKGYLRAGRLKTRQTHTKSARVDHLVVFGTRSRSINERARFRSKAKSMSLGTPTCNGRIERRPSLRTVEGKGGGWSFVPFVCVCVCVFTGSNTHTHTHTPPRNPGSDDGWVQRCVCGGSDTAAEL